MRLVKLHKEEFTNARPYHYHDDALAESKDSSMGQKRFGYGHIPCRYPMCIDRFGSGVLLKHLNYQRS